MSKNITVKSSVSGLESPHDGQWDYDGGGNGRTGDSYSVGLYVWVKHKGKLVRGPVKFRIRGFSDQADEVHEIALSMCRGHADKKSLDLTRVTQRADRPRINRGAR